MQMKWMFWDFMLLWLDFYLLILHSSIRQRGAGRPVDSRRADGLKVSDVCALLFRLDDSRLNCSWGDTESDGESLQNISSPVPLQTSCDPRWKGHLVDDFTLLTQRSQIFFPWMSPYVALKHLMTTCNLPSSTFISTSSMRQPWIDSLANKQTNESYKKSFYAKLYQNTTRFTYLWPLF